jgi:predicted dehydrogenase
MELAPSAELVAVASRSEERARAWAEEHGAKKAYGSYEELIADPDVQALYIPLPPTLHSRWSIAAAQAGKHVLCEKPLTMDLQEARDLAAACADAGVQLMDGVMWVHHTRSDAIRKLLDAGELGELRRVTAAFAFNWGATIPKNNIRAQGELGGGALGDLGYYCIRAILWALGEVPAEVAAVARYAAGVDIEMSATLFFDRERTASFDCGFTSRGRGWFEIAGSEASLTVDGFVVPPSEDSSDYSISRTPGAREVLTVGPCVQEARMVERFSSIVERCELDPGPPREALDTVRVCMAVAEAAKTKRKIAVR